MTQWGRKENYSWPSHRPLGTIWAYLNGLLAILAVVVYQYERWTPLQQYWLPKYFKTWFMTQLGIKTSQYQTATVQDTRKSKNANKAGFILLVPVVQLDDPVPPGALPFDLPEDFKQHGFRLVPEKARYPNQELHDTIRREIYQDQTFMGFMFWPLIGGASVFVIGLAFGIPRDLK